LGLYRIGDEVTAVFLLFRRGLLESSRRFAFASALPQPLLLGDLVTRFYEGDCYVPPEVLVPGELAESRIIEEWLADKRGAKVNIRVPRRGEGRRQVQMAEQNARLADAVQADGDRRRKVAARRLAEILEIEEPPERIHCLDVSTIQGTSTVASRVCFVGGRPNKSRYRSFRISAAAAGDDFAALQEAVRRSLLLCLEKEDGELPDLLVVDGGRGQLTAARRAMDELGIGDELTVGALAKSHLRGVGDRRRPTGERLFLSGGRIRPLVSGDPETTLVASLRDEAHRFAITYHRKLRGRLTSVLDDIVGVGPGRRTLLLRHFGSLRGVRNAELEDLHAVPGLPRQVAEAVYQGLRGQPRG
jgi:excinuclease ABC subunit C